MAQYPRLNTLLMQMGVNDEFDKAQNYLEAVWLDEYFQNIGDSEASVVSTVDYGFSYLFDISQGRLIAAGDKQRKTSRCT